MSWHFVRFQEIEFQTDAESFSFLSWKTKKVLFLKKYSAKIDPKDGVSRPSFQWRFWVYHIPFVSPRSEPLNLSSPLEVGEEVLVRYPSRTIDPGLSAISEMKKKKWNSLHNVYYRVDI